jgi:type III pantothenate kinase
VILLLDIGNTRIKWAQLMDGSLTPQQSILHRGVATDTWTKQLFRERFRPARLLVASVAGGDMATTVRAEAKKAWSIVPEFASSTGLAGGVTNAYAEPSTLGVDRWLAVIAGRELTGGAACVIDAGTAMTIDVVSADGLHVGGMILPGVQMMVDALLQRTSDIADNSRRSRARAGAEPRPGHVFASNTGQAILNGALLAVAAAADRAVAEAATTLKAAAPRVLLTGGDAERLVRMMQTKPEIVPDLVLRGLAVLARKPS